MHQNNNNNVAIGSGAILPSLGYTVGPGSIPFAHRPPRVAGTLAEWHRTFFDTESCTPSFRLIVLRWDDNRDEIHGFYCTYLTHRIAAVSTWLSEIAFGPGGSALNFYSHGKTPQAHLDAIINAVHREPDFRL
jgi:hypothetical protein